ncbi:hypothetical protein PBY51_004692 [Eleginops maclovinus]|uniref:Uncharacterized protein n=1 Tax=Eleginops maclovinus TaxID=56733 RepID=A0AAN7X562_ELEMC|nr:hypothetical protein PBY51_004692 [Eleginops maclovinus]
MAQLPPQSQKRGETSDHTRRWKYARGRNGKHNPTFTPREESTRGRPPGNRTGKCPSDSTVRHPYGPRRNRFALKETPPGITTIR